MGNNLVDIPREASERFDAIIAKRRARLVIVGPLVAKVSKEHAIKLLCTRLVNGPMSVIEAHRTLQELMPESHASDCELIAIQLDSGAKLVKDWAGNLLVQGFCNDGTDVLEVL